MDDLISRQAVLENAFAIYTHECGLVEVVGVATIKDLPSVKPQKKTGHWEEVGEEYIQVYDLNGIPSCGDERICSECGFKTVFIGEHCSQYKYCPYCGARMDQEPYDVPDTNDGKLSENPIDSKDVIWYSKRNYSEIVVEPQERSEE